MSTADLVVSGGTCPKCGQPTIPGVLLDLSLDCPRVRQPVVKPAQPPLPRVRFVRQYTNWTGRQFRRYQADDGRVVDVLVRTGRKDGMRAVLTNAEAKTEAARRLAG